MLAPLFESRPSPFEMRDDDQRRVGRVARGHQVLPVPLVPAECRDPVVVAVQDACLARRGHRRQDRLPARQLVVPVADQLGHRVDRAGAHPAGEDRVRQAVDLDDHEPGLSDAPSSVFTSSRWTSSAVVGAAAVDPEDRRQDRVDDRVDERADQRGHEAVDVDAGANCATTRKATTWRTRTRTPTRTSEIGAANDQHHGPDRGVEQGHEDDGERCVHWAIDGHASAEDRGRREERDRGHDQRDDQPLQQRDRPALPLPQHPDLRRVEVQQAAQVRRS